MRRVFSAAATKGWAWCNQSAERTAALRNLLLAASGCLEFPKVMAGMDSLDKHVANLFSGVSHIFQTQQLWDKSSSAATKGWAWCSYNTELMARTSALKNLKFLVGIGCLEFQKSMAGIDSLDKNVEQIFFWHCITFCEHLKGWQPHFQPTVAKSSISTIVHWFAAVT